MGMVAAVPDDSTAQNGIAPGIADARIGEFLEALRVERNYSEHTVRAYRRDLESYAAWCDRGGVDPLRAGRREMRAYLGYLNAAGYARTTVNRRLSGIRGFYGWLADAGVSDNDPTITMTALKKQRRLPRKISAGEMARILAVHGPRDVQGKPRIQDAADLRDQAVLELLYASGCRISEAASLKPGDIDFPGRKVKVLGKGSKERVVPLHDLCLASLRAYLENGRPHLRNPRAKTDALFLSARGNAFSDQAIRKMFRETLKAAGVNPAYTPHDMRHTFASDLLEGGADLRSVQELLGHASPSTTQIYTHLSPGYLKDVHKRAHPRG